MALSTTKTKTFQLPVEITGHTELGRLLRELELLEGAFIKTASQEDKDELLPPAGGLLDQVVRANGYQLAEKNHRAALAAQLTKIRDHAPELHISFAAEAPPELVQKLLAWLRANIHPYALVQVGLMPSIAAGCVLRTPNKIFDMSLGAKLQEQKPYLLELIKGAARARTT